ncbi:MAG: 30S ribosomal protein S6 [Deltaproteobacteria bacterium RIFOXYD12_FULL_57_12]|nr:MAG: 30S ribosomal protein S6 [Deltaproteobacteria bacterium RIFOXYD12_FULL_57_12]
MRRYETILIVRPNVGDDDIAAIVERLSAIITNDSGTVIRVDRWGLKKLAYLIKKENQGNYVYVDYAGQPAAVTELERILRIDDRVLKYMTVKQADDCDPVALLAEAAAKQSAATAEAVAPIDEDAEPTEEMETDSE